MSVFGRKVSRGKGCCAALCTNRQYLADGTRSGVRFFKIPIEIVNNPKMRTMWCNLIKRKDGKDNFHFSKSTNICSEHFKLCDIIVTDNGMWRLKPGVKPTVFAWTKPRIIRSDPSNRKYENGGNEVNNLDNSSIAITTAELQEGDHGIKAASPIATCTTPTEEEDTVNHGLDHSYTTVRNQTSSPNMEDYTISSCEELQCQIESLKNELQEANKDIESLKSKVKHYESQRFTIEKIKEDNAAVMFYTGFPNYSIFEAVCNYLEGKAERLQYWRGKNESKSTGNDCKSYNYNRSNKPGPKRKMSFREEFFMILVRLRVGLFVRDLADRFDISQSQFSKTFTTLINFLNEELRLLFPFPSQDLIRQNMPISFADYPSTRIILDCTEVRIETPSAMLAQSQTWSNYKHFNTYKVLVGVAPTGNITFVSDLWGGRASDKEITYKSGILDLMNEGDNIMADRGFDIGDILPKKVSLNIPPFKGSKTQLSSKEVEETMAIASVRIHVERAIGRIKNYHILDGTLPLSLSHIANQLFKVVAYLTCFLPPLVPPRDDVGGQ